MLLLTHDVTEMNGLLVCSGTADVKNIGDYIQSVAQEQFYDKIDIFVEREHLNEYSSTAKTKLIMNGWFMHHPDCFPPSESIVPLFVSFHIVPRIESRFFTSETIAYLKQYEPIGARDTGTMNMLQKYDIKSYFSGCLTLALGLKYKSGIKREERKEIVFVDPAYDFPGWGRKANVICCASAMKSLACHFGTIRKLYKVFVAEGGNRLPRYLFPIYKILAAASFYEVYSKMFSDELLLHSDYITHTVKQKEYRTNESKMDYARRLISRYSNAKMVITSRIHCALPCLGVETPVIFVNSRDLNKGKKRSGGRFGGIINLFYVLNLYNGNRWDYDRLDFPAFKDKIGLDFVFDNKQDYIPLRDSLIDSVTKFVGEDIE